MVINAINLCCYSSFQTPTVGPLELYSLQISQVVILKCLSFWFICHSLIIYQSRFEFKHADTLETICWGSRVSLTRLSVQEGWSEEIAMRPSTRLSSIRNRARSSSGFLRETLINPRAGIFRMHGSETEGVVILWCLQGGNTDEENWGLLNHHALLYPTSARKHLISGPVLIWFSPAEEAWSAALEQI